MTRLSKINPGWKIMNEPLDPPVYSPESKAGFSQKDYPVTILLIDDRPLVGEVLRRKIAHEKDINFFYCSNPVRAIPMALEYKPTVILLDLVMPEIDGLMLLRFLRANPKTREIPVLVLSTEEQASLKGEAFAAGASDYLIKFPDPIELIARIRHHSKGYINFLKQQEAYQELQALHESLEQRVDDRTKELRQTVENLQKTQAQLIHAEKMSALGQLVAGIAHEINNPLQFIAGNICHAKEYTRDLLTLLQLYQDSTRDPSPQIQAFIEQMDWEFVSEDLPNLMSSLESGVERIQEISTDMRDFSRMDQGRRTSGNIHEGIDSSLVILQHRLKAGQIQLVKDYGPLPEIECCIGQLNQVFINLIGNAIDALEMEKDPGVDPEEELQRSPGFPVTPRVPTICIQTEVKNQTVVIRISDNGQQGIPPEIQAKLFEPFFTTKPVGKGTGLGLSISYHIIVEKHHGVLTCISTPGEGTTFEIVLPLNQAEPLATEEKNSEGPLLSLERDNRAPPSLHFQRWAIA
jgi:two-component system, NtrC family, sensor kinase